jgi:hypothetical protein
LYYVAARSTHELRTKLTLTSISLSCTTMKGSKRNFLTPVKLNLRGGEVTIALSIDNRRNGLRQSIPVLEGKDFKCH